MCCLIRIKEHYIPHQISEEKFQPYKSYIVPASSKLFGIVYSYYEFEVEENYTMHYIPDACPELGFIYGENVFESLVGGPRTDIFNTNHQKNTTSFCVRFCIGEMKNICLLPMKNLVNKVLPLDSVIVNAKDFINEMQITNSFSERVNLVDHFLLGMYENTYLYQKSILNYCVTEILNTEGNILVSELAKKSGYSTRYINMIFSEFIGHSPKQLSNIIKFQKSFYNYYENREQSLSQLAWNHNYYDIAHMDRSYKTLTSYTPASLAAMLF